MHYHTLTSMWGVVKIDYQTHCYRLYAHQGFNHSHVQIVIDLVLSKALASQYALSHAHFNVASDQTWLANSLL